MDRSVVVALDAWEMVGLGIESAVYVGEETLVQQVLNRAADVATAQGRPTESIRWLRTLQAILTAEGRSD